MLRQRLARAHQMLSDPRQDCRTVASIAFMVGFSDLSYFNRTSESGFSVAPSAVRAR